MTSLLLLTNRGAGSAQAGKVEAALAVLRSRADVEVVFLTGGQHDLDGLLDRRGGRRVVVAGGDGTLHQVVAALHRRGELSQAVLALVPLGTGNDFARAVGVPLEVEGAARLVLEGNLRSVDLIVDDLGDIAVNNVHVGVGVEASRSAATWKERLGRAGYGIGLLRSAFHPAFRLAVDVDGERVADLDRPVLEVSVGNGSTIGGGLNVNPGANPYDGRLDVLVSFASGPLRRISYGIDLFRAAHPERPDVFHRQASSLTVAGAPFYTSADGEVSGPEPRRSWRLERAAFRMPLPAGRPGAE